MEASGAGRNGEAAALFLEAQQQFEALGLLRDAGDAYVRAAPNLILARRLEEARRVAEEGLAFARHHNFSKDEDAIAGYLAGLLLGLCEFEALSTVLKAHAGAAMWMADRVAVNWALQRGDPAAARDMLPAVEVAGGVPLELAQIHALHARTLMASGDPGAAREQFIRMRELMQSSGIGREFDGIMIEYRAVGIADEAGLELADAAFLRAVLEYYRTSDEVSYLTPGGSSQRELYGRYALALGEIAEAEQAFVETLEWALSEGAHVIAGQCHQGLAEVASRTSETAEAMRHLDAAAELFNEHGAKLYLDQVIAKKLELQGAGSSDTQTSLVSLTMSVQEQRPDVAAHAAPNGTVTLLFSDIEGSTALNVELGDDAWVDLLGEHNRLVRDAIAEHGGFEVSTEGDSFFVVFGSARDAVRCAQAMQAALGARNSKADRAVRVRIGLHTGEPVSDADNFYGSSVAMASRVASTAEGGEILVSSLLRDLVAASGEFELTAREAVALKGLDGEHVTYAVGWA